MAATERLFGSSIKRREDPRLITGKGTFVDDVKLPGTLYAAFVRSPHAHAKIARVGAGAARKLKGVVAVYTGKALVDGGIKPIPVGWLLPGIKVPARHVIAVDRARHAGEAVAMVVAESPYIARDAAELVDVDYQPLPAVVEGPKAMARDAPQLHAEAPNNVSFQWQLGEAAKVDAAFKGAAKVIKQRI